MTIYSFDQFRFDTKGETLFDGDEEITIRPQTAQLMALLIANKGRAVSKDELVEAVWGDAFVNDQAIFQSINQLRKALGENARKPKYLKTVPRKGYQWICETEADHTQARADAASTHVPQPLSRESVHVKIESPSSRGKKAASIGKWAFLLVALIASSLLYISLKPGPPQVVISEASPVRLAILPFINETGDPEKQWIELGLMDMVARTFSLNSDAKPIGPERILKALKDCRIERGTSLTSTHLDRIKRLLGADWVISASVKSQSGGFQLNYKAYGPKNGVENSILESDTLAALAHSFEAQINDMLEKGAIRTKYEVFSKDPFVNESYAQGMQLHLKSQYARAIPYFEVCLHKDPQFLWAQLRLAREKVNLSDINEASQLADSLLEKARARNDKPLIAETLTLLGDLAMGRDDLAGQISNYKDAMDLWHEIKDEEKESRLLVDLAMALSEQGKREDASALFQKALHQAEASRDRYRLALVHDMWGLMAMDEEAFQEARAHWEKAFAIWSELAAWEEAVFTLISIAEISEQKEEWDHAVSLLMECLSLVETHQLAGASSQVLSGLGSVSREAGRLEDSASYFKKALGVAKDMEDFGAQCIIGLELAELALASDGEGQARSLAEDCLALSQEIGYILMETDVRLFLAELDMNQKDFSSARIQVQKTMALSPDYSEPYLVSARISIAENKCDDALATLGKMKEKWPGSWGTEAVELEKTCQSNQ